MQKDKYPSLEKQGLELRNSVDAIDPEVMTLEQKKTGQAIFYQYTGLLEKMN